VASYYHHVAVVRGWWSAIIIMLLWSGVGGQLCTRSVLEGPFYNTFGEKKEQPFDSERGGQKKSAGGKGGAGNIIRRRGNNCGFREFTGINGVSNRLIFRQWAKVFGAIEDESKLYPQHKRRL